MNNLQVICSQINALHIALFVPFIIFRSSAVGGQLYIIESSHCIMAKYECQKCGWVGKPIFMEPATRLCPKCRSTDMKKVKKEKE